MQTVELLRRMDVIPVAGATVLVDASSALEQIRVVMPWATPGKRVDELPAIAIYWHRVVLQRFVARLYGLRRGNRDVRRIVQQWEAALQLVAQFPMLYRPGRKAGSREIDQGEAGCLCYRIRDGRVEILEMRVSEEEV